jgi:hypothetical protein
MMAPADINSDVLPTRQIAEVHKHAVDYIRASDRTRIRRRAALTTHSLCC